MYARSTLVAAVGLVLAAVVQADAPHTYAITGARIVTAVGPPLENGTVIVRHGLIEAVGAGVASPRDAVIIEGKGLTVYPGLIDMGNAAGLDIPAPAPPQDAKTREEVELWKRHLILRPQFQAAAEIKPDAPALSKLASAGITTVLSTPPGEVVRGQSALVNVAAPDDQPQIGNVADERRGLVIVKAPVLLHVAFPANPRGNAYPDSLMGVIAFVRQSFLDAGQYQLERAQYARRPQGAVRPVYDEALEAMGPALARRMPVALEARSATEIRRALQMARELALDPVIEGAVEAAETAAELKAQNARVVFSLNYPARPKRLAPDADESIRDLRTRANAPGTPAALQRAGVLFAFESAGLKEAKDFIKNAARAVKAGLASDAAVKALTINAAMIAGASDQLGSIEPGKIANLVVSDGDLFDDKTRIVRVFVDGRPVSIKPPSEDDTEKRDKPGR